MQLDNRRTPPIDYILHFSVFHVPLLFEIKNSCGCSVSAVSGVRLGYRELIPCRAGYFSLLHSVHTGCGSHPSIYLRGIVGLFLTVTWSRREAAYSPPSGAEVNKVSRYVSKAMSSKRGA
jgi:hypothetical protein